MNKKLPKIYHSDETLTSNNRDSYYSFSKENSDKIKKIVETPKKELNNFFSYFNKEVTIITIDDKILNTRILSKRNDLILLEDGTYLNLNKIKSIN